MSDGPYNRDGETVYATSPESGSTETERDWPDYTDPEWLHYQYHVLNKSQPEMADLVGVTPPTIRYHMQKHNIETREKGKATSLALGGDERLWDEKWLREQYNDKERSIPEIAELREVGTQTVSKALQRFGIETRDRSTAIQLGYDSKYGDKKYRDKNWMEHQYLTLGKSMSEIANENGWGDATVCRWLHRHGINTRSKKESHLLAIKQEKCRTRGAADDGRQLVSESGIDASWHDITERSDGRRLEYRDPEWLQARVDEGLAQEEIADRCSANVTQGTISVWLNRFGIERAD